MRIKKITTEGKYHKFLNTSWENLTLKLMSLKDYFRRTFEP